MGAVGLHADKESLLVELLDKGCCVLERRFASGEDDHGEARALRFNVIRKELKDSINNFFVRHLAEVAEVGVAERTGEVASRQAYEDGRPASVVAFALQRIENLVNPHQFSIINCPLSILN